MQELRIFIGYDSKEPIAYHVLAHSILSRSTIPVSITPLALGNLRGVFTRERGPKESTEFSISRFLVPYLSGYQGYSVFMDCDMLCRVDLRELVETQIYRTLHTTYHRQRLLEKYAVLVCPHDYVPKTETKFLGQEQTKYPRKNWSSFMVFNNARCQDLTPRVVNTESGLYLHRFQWILEAQIEFLPLTWNWLVGEYDTNPQAKILHYTLGGPWFPEYRDCDHAPEWFNECEHMGLELAGAQRVRVSV